MVAIRKRENKYQAIVSLGIDHKSGKYRRKTFTAKTKSEARKKAEDFQRRHVAGIDVVSGAMPFAEIVPIYWEVMTTEKKLAIGTLREYKRLFKEMSEILGDVSFNKISSNKIREAVYAANTANQRAVRLTVLRNIFKWAMQETPPLIEVNPTANIKPVAVPKSAPGVVYTKEELSTILDAAAGTLLEHAIFIQYSLALRFSELRALRWSDIELFDKPKQGGKSGVATIQWQLTADIKQLTSEEDFTQTKGKEKRELPISSDLARFLKHVRVEQHKTALRLGNLWQENDLVVTYMTPAQHRDYAGGPINYRTSLNTLKKILQKTGINGRVSTHAFRHTCAAHLFDKGTPMKKGQRFLGHTMLATTDKYYGHLTSDSLDELPAALLRRA